ncbi:MAG: potassium channel protein [Deltaproteobacteria bacterium]|nr:potassium channel protein [Deltaproteobacteria bacterium]
MNPIKHLILSAGMLFSVLVIGTTGYMFIEGWHFIDALYMTVITLTTVGFEEVHRLSPEGRIFTIGLVMSGVFFFLYAAGTFVEFLVEGQIRNILGRRKLNRKIKGTKDHYIVCGYGRIGKVLCGNFLDQGVHPVVIEKAADSAAALEAAGLLYVAGDSTEEETLLAAGIKRAKGLIAALGTDTDNVFLVLTARQLNPKIFILARAGTDKAKAKLMAAGANRVEAPYEIGAISMAQRILRPSVTSFLDLVFTYDREDIKMEEIPVDPASPLVDIMLKDSGIRQKYNLIIIAVKKPDGKMLFNPSFETVIHGGDTLIAMGKRNSLIALSKDLCPDRDACMQNTDH